MKIAISIIGFAVLLLGSGCTDSEAQGPAQTRGAQGSVSAARPSPDAIATAMVDVSLPADWAGPFKNLLGTGEGEGKEAWLQFLAALRKAVPTADFQDDLRLAQTAVTVRPLFKAGAVQANVATLYKKRVETIVAGDIARWKLALQSKCNLNDLSKDWRVALEMLQVDSLWAAPTPAEQNTPRSLGRLESIPSGKIDDWRDNSSTGCVDLLRVEGLFVNDRFDSALFERALPFAKEKYAARSAEQEKKK